jgi:rhodanese-related sulfurtransferase
MSVKTIAPSELAELRQKNAAIDLIDVRTPMEFREVHLTGARNVPLDQLEPAAVMKARGPAEKETLYVICRTGSRGQQACERFMAAGYENAINVEGGTLAGEAQGLPVVRGPKMMSLERQVRIAAGSLVLTGLALGWWVHEVFLGLSAFVGAGLVFAGITDTCGMGLMLAKMPWNRVPSEACHLPGASPQRS